MQVVITGLGNSGFKKVLDSKIPIAMIQRYDQENENFYDCYIIIDSKTRFNLCNINTQIVRLSINDSVLYIKVEDFIEMRFA